MKNLTSNFRFLIICFTLFILLPNVSNSQTTTEEFNYLTKGLKIQLENGLDLKKGYKIEEIDKARVASRSVILSKLSRISDNSIAAYLLRYQKDEYSAVEYICIPHPNSSQVIKDLFFESLKPEIVDVNTRLALFTFLLTRNLDW
jgi:hypothetical protein